MEARPKEFALSDDEKSVMSNDHLHATLNNAQLHEVGEELEPNNQETDIQVKYYLEYKKIYYTSFKLWTEIRKQAKLRDAALHKIAQVEVPSRIF